MFGAYCAAPSTADDSTAERRWYAALRAEPLITGLELPFAGTLHPKGPGHLAGLLDPGWRNVVTDIPHADARARADSRYGLASADTDGRAHALEDARRLFEEVAELGERVAAVELHSAPPVRGGSSSAEAFAESLAQIAQWQWGESVLCVEHVDAPADGRPAAKGFLTLGEETEAVLAASTGSGRRIVQGINWGRSAIEGRSALTPIDHLNTLRAAGTLGGLMFSGVAGSGAAAWHDAHLGMAEDDPGSILTESALHAGLEATPGGGIDFIGVKMRAPSVLTGSAQQRMSPGLSALRVIEEWAAQRGGARRA